VTEECFDPLTVVVRYDGEDELVAALPAELLDGYTAIPRRVGDVLELPR
jgi:hypothetical protein